MGRIPWDGAAVMAFADPVFSSSRRTRPGPVTRRRASEIDAESQRAGVGTASSERMRGFDRLGRVRSGKRATRTISLLGPPHAPSRFVQEGLLRGLGDTSLCSACRARPTLSASAPPRPANHVALGLTPGPFCRSRGHLTRKAAPPLCGVRNRPSPPSAALGFAVVHGLSHHGTRSGRGPMYAT